MATKFLNLSTDATLGGNNARDDIIASQRAIKQYVDNKFTYITVETRDITIPTALDGAVSEPDV